jgi:hypothetical protein
VKLELLISEMWTVGLLELDAMDLRGELHADGYEEEEG